MSESIPNVEAAVRELGALPVPVGPQTQESRTAAEDLDFLHRVTLPDLRREVEHHKDGKARWRARAEKAEARVAELEAGLPAMQEALFKALDRVTELEAERHSTNEALDDAVRALRARQTEEPGSVCRCDEPDADPYACEAEDCTHEFSELNPFGGSTLPVEKASAEVSKTCGCGWRTSVWHVDDGSAEEELHRHVVRVHGGVYPRSEAGDVR